MDELHRTCDDGEPYFSRICGYSSQGLDRLMTSVEDDPLGPTASAFYMREKRLALDFLLLGQDGMEPLSSTHSKLLNIRPKAQISHAFIICELNRGNVGNSDMSQFRLTSDNLTKPPSNAR
jgi:hypothetical protein